MFSGSIPALATPFNKSGKPCKKTYRKLVNWHIRQGSNGILVAGCTGESFTLNEDERDALLSVAVDAVKKAKKKIPVIMGTGASETKLAMDRTKRAKKLGADAVLVITPFGNKPTQTALVEYFEKIADVGLPVILYNVPSRTGTNLLPDTVIKLSRHPNIVAIKEASGNLDSVSAILNGAAKDFVVLSGDDALTLPMLAIGAKGVISTVANIAPKQFSEMVSLFFDGDIEGARKIHLKMFPVIKALFAEGNPVPLKAAMSMMGLCENRLRQPLVPASKKTVDLLKSAMKKAGLL